jgi:hypothetical protein
MRFNEAQQRWRLLALGCVYNSTKTAEASPQ